MSRRVAVLRPEPGNAATAARLSAMGVVPLALPLFAVAALPWTPPDPAGHDVLLLTSANTLRHGGAGLAGLRSLTAMAVGEATARAARAAGFEVVASGAGGAAELVEAAAARGFSRALHLGGREAMIAPGGPVTRTIAVYASEARDVDARAFAQVAGGVAMLHSARAAARFAELVDEFALDRATIRLAAISKAALGAAGDGWAQTQVAAAPDDASLVAAALRLAD